MRSHLADTLRAFVDEILGGLGRLGGGRADIVDREPTGGLAGRPKGAKDSLPRKPYTRNVPAPT